LRLGTIDRPGERKIHTVPTPLMGGMAVYVAFAVAVVVTVPLSVPVVGLLAGCLAAVVVGAVDERFTLPPLLHLAGQNVAALIAIVSGVGVIQTVSNPFSSLTSPGWHLPLLVGGALTLFWLVGMMNTINFLDGLDGLATGVVAIAAFLLAAWAFEEQRLYIPAMAHHQDLVLPLALAGALLGFLPYNWHHAKIFLGDSGAMFLGLGLAAISIVGPAKLATMLFIVLIPVLDVAWAIVRRMLNGRSFLSGDKQHVYHRMRELGLGTTGTVVTLYGLCLLLAGLDLALVRVFKLVAFVVLAIVTITVFVWLEIRAAGRLGGDKAPPASSARPSAGPPELHRSSPPQ